METNVTLVFCTACESGSHVAGGPENILNMDPEPCVAGDYCDFIGIAHLQVQAGQSQAALVQASKLFLEICRSRADSWPFSAFKDNTFHPAINNWIDAVHQNGCRRVQVAH